MTSATPPPPGPNDAVVTSGVDNPVPEDQRVARPVQPSATNAPADSPAPDNPAPDNPAQRAGEPVVAPAEIRPAIIWLSALITGGHAIMTAVGVAADADGIRNGVAVVSVALFFLGALSFVVAFVIAAGRSRYEDLWFGGAFFLTGGVVPNRARTALMSCLAIQCVVGLVGASLAPFTPVAFVVLVPLSAMGLMSLYGARWGEFSLKAEDD